MRSTTLNVIIIAAIVVVSYFIGSSILFAYVFPNLGPVQPINFSHRIHASGDGIPCQFCHIYASKSKVSGIPSVQKCIGCHKSIKVFSKEIKKIQAAWDTKKPIKWIKVYDLPDYIYFPHKRHVKAEVKCQECHGPVENMERVYKFSPLGMGWCLTCHEEKNGPTDCWECHI